MRTTLNIDGLLIKQLLEATHEKSKTRAISIAIKDYLKKKHIKKIRRCIKKCCSNCRK